MHPSDLRKRPRERNPNRVSRLFDGLFATSFLIEQGEQNTTTTTHSISGIK
jgi:hypothetical protein